MTDPVRPVAPREDEETQCAKMLIELAFLLPRGTNVAEHSAGRQLVRYVKAIRTNALAAAPVPCAASPADPWQPIETAPQDWSWFLAWSEDLGFLVYRSGPGLIPAEEPDPTHWMPLPSPPRATGEGARDEMPTSETRTAGGPTRRSAVGIMADAGVHDLQGEANRRSSVESVAREADYLRGYATALIDAIAAIEFARDKGGKDDAAFDGMNAAVFALRQMRPPASPVSADERPTRIIAELTREVSKRLDEYESDPDVLIEARQLLKGAPVAVSLDPHRLLPASADDILMGAAILLEDFRGFLMASDESYHTDPGISADALRQLAARLRGEATVRPEVNRFEVIDETGRLLTRRIVNVELSYQDDGRTLKVFLKRAQAAVRVEE